MPSIYSLNRQAALHNIQTLCPEFATVLINAYRDHTELFVGDNTIPSRGGTTQGDPLAMGIYALGTLPLIPKLNHLASQVQYADKALAGGTLQQPCHCAWWNSLISLGPAIGYFTTPHMTWFIVKRHHLKASTDIFHGTRINITAEGRRHLVAALGEWSFVDIYVKDKITKWMHELEVLTTIAKMHPQDAYSALTHGLMSK